MVRILCKVGGAFSTSDSEGYQSVIQRYVRGYSGVAVLLLRVRFPGAPTRLWTSGSKNGAVLGLGRFDSERDARAQGQGLVGLADGGQERWTSNAGSERGSRIVVRAGRAWAVRKRMAGVRRQEPRVVRLTARGLSDSTGMSHDGCIKGWALSTGRNADTAVEVSFLVLYRGIWPPATARAAASGGTPPT